MMKKIYSLALGMAVIASANAQIPTGKYAAVGKNNQWSETKQKPNTQIDEKVTVLWTNDFSNPSDWTMSNQSTPPTDWVISTNTNAAPVTAFQPVNFTTAANGFAIIDSDGPGPNATQDAIIGLVNPITACASSPTVVLRFSQAHRRYLESTFIQVSNDNVNWTEIEVNENMATNTNSPNPEQVSVNITSVAANQAQVWIRFRYVGAYDWFWAVDDVELVEPDANDIKAVSVYAGLEGAWGVRMPIYSLPLSQIQPYKFGGIVRNVGGATQNSVTVSGVIPSTYTGTSTPGTLAPFEQDTFDLVPDFTPAGTGNFTMNMAAVLANDANPNDNAFKPFKFNVSADVYARDTLVRGGGSFNQGAGFELGNLFDIFTNETLYSIDVDIHPTTAANTEISVKLYTIDANGDFVYIAESDLLTLSTAQIGTVVRVPLQAPQPLTAGEVYIPVVVYQGGAGNGLRVGTAGVSAPQTTFLYDIASTTWFFTTTTPMVRMVFQNNVGLTETERFVNMTVFPNPANESATVRFNAENNANAVVTLTDISGKTVFTQDLKNVSGSQEVAVPVADLNAGIYVVRVTMNGHSFNSKLTVK